MRIQIFAFASFLSITIFLLTACANQPSVEHPPKINNAAEARGAALSYITSVDGDEAPSPGGDWSAEDIDTGRVGSEAWKFIKGEWTVTVTYPVVAPENIIYSVEIKDAEDGWYWMGTVEASGYVSEMMPFSKFNEERSRELAREFIVSSPTFSFDGIQESLVLAETLYPDIEYAWQFIFEFDCRHPGYGNRADQVLAQVITPHRASIAIEKYEVISAIMDDQWDMINQEPTDSSAPPVQVPAAPNDSIVTARVIDIKNVSGDLPWEIVIEIESSEHVPGYHNATENLIGEHITVKTTEDLSGIEEGEEINANVKLEGDENTHFYLAFNIESN